MKKIYYVSILTALLLGVYSCATQGNPSGGRNDITPPVALKFTPENYSTNFSASTIEITFDELIKFKELRKELIISPPLNIAENIKPGFTPSKKIVIDLSKETLLPNTTYTINFGNAVTDNNEGNLLPNFKYVFSTGTTIDSLFIGGVVEDAFEEKFDPKTSILLYKIDSTFNDSTIYKQRPTYFTRLAAEKDSTFRIDNIAAGTYHLVALIDENSNMRYDPLKESFGVFPRPIVLSETDSTKTGYKVRLSKANPPFRMYQGVNTQKGLIQIPLAGLNPNIEIERIFPEKAEGAEDFYIYSQKKDSLQYWFTEDISDSIMFVSKINGVAKDTMVAKIRKAPDSKFSVSFLSPSIDLGEDIFIKTNKPIRDIDKSLIEVINKDSIAQPFTIELDSVVRKEAKVAFKKSPSSSYTVTVFPGAVTDIFDQQAKDTLNRTFKMKSEEDYGNLKLSPISFKAYPVIFQLLSSDGKKIIREEIIQHARVISFPLLTPSFYRLRAILDSNENGKWDPGDYPKKLLPERVIYFKDKIEIKAFWDVEQQW